MRGERGAEGSCARVRSRVQHRRVFFIPTWLDVNVTPEAALSRRCIFIASTAARESGRNADGAATACCARGSRVDPAFVFVAHFGATFARLKTLIGQPVYLRPSRDRYGGNGPARNVPTKASTSRLPPFKGARYERIIESHRDSARRHSRAIALCNIKLAIDHQFL